MVAQLREIKCRVVNATEVTAASHATRIVAAKEFDQHQLDFDCSFVIPPKRSKGLAKMLYKLLSQPHEKTAGG